MVYKLILNDFCNGSDDPAVIQSWRTHALRIVRLKIEELTNTINLLLPHEHKGEPITGFIEECRSEKQRCESALKAFIELHGDEPTSQLKQEEACSLAIFAEPETSETVCDVEVVEEED